MAKQDDWMRLTVRIPPELYERLQAAVSAGPNSMNAEIVSRLESSLDENVLHSQEIPSLSAMSTFSTLKILELYMDIPGVDMRVVIDTFIKGSRKVLLSQNTTASSLVDILDKNLNNEKLQELTQEIQQKSLDKSS